MPDRSETESRKLLKRLRDTLAERGQGQERLDRITHLIADSIGTEVCSIYLFRDAETLGTLRDRRAEARGSPPDPMKLGEGLVGRVARTATPVNSANAPAEKGFRFMPETGEELYSSFLGVPIQRVGERLGVLVVQSKEQRLYSDDEIYALEVVAMVLAEMAELGAFTGEGEAMSAKHKQPVMYRGGVGQEGTAEGRVWLHEPRVVVTNPVADDPVAEIERLRAAVQKLASRSTTFSRSRRSTRTRSRCWKPIACSPIRAAGCAGWKRTSRRASRPRPQSRRSNPPPAAGWSRSPTPTCATACTISTTFRTVSCAS